MRTALLACLASLALLGCGQAREPETDDRRYAPPGPGAPPSDEAGLTVQVRNSCPEAVVLAISATAPDPSTPTMTLLSTKVADVTVAKGSRIWLRYDGRFSEELSLLPAGGAVEVGYQCNAIYSRDGDR